MDGSISADICLKRVICQMLNVLKFRASIFKCSMRILQDECIYGCLHLEI